MKTLIALALLISAPAFATAPHVLKADQSAVLTTCAAVGDSPNEVAKLNALLLASKLLVDGNIEVDAPFTVSAPSYSSAGNNQTGYSWCVAVTLTKH